MFAVPFYRVTCLYSKVKLIVVKAHFFTFTVYEIRGIWIDQLTPAMTMGSLWYPRIHRSQNWERSKKECCPAWKWRLSEGWPCLLYQVNKNMNPVIIPFFPFTKDSTGTFLRSSLGNLLFKPRPKLLIIIWNIEFTLYNSALKITQRGDSRNSYNPV